MEVIAAPLLIFFFIFNLVIYHKIFRVFYFNFAAGIRSEIVGSLFLSCIETGLVIYLGGYILIGIAIIVGIVIVLSLIKKAVGNSLVDPSDNPIESPEEYIKNQVKNCDTADENDVSDTRNYVNNSEITKNVSNSETSKSTTTMTVDEGIKIIKEKYRSDEKVKAIKEFRELTGLGLKEAKDIIDQILVDVEIARVESGTEIVIEEKRIFCPHCGKKIMMNARFCCYCGKSNTYKK